MRCCCNAVEWTGREGSVASVDVCVVACRLGLLCRVLVAGGGCVGAEAELPHPPRAAAFSPFWFVSQSVLNQSINLFQAPSHTHTAAKTKSTLLHSTGDCDDGGGGGGREAAQQLHMRQEFNFPPPVTRFNQPQNPPGGGSGGGRCPSSWAIARRFEDRWTPVSGLITYC